jgi:hypothetical protein
MKHVILFEQFVNEANELIKAQEVCKSAIFQSQKLIDSLFKKILAKDWIKKYQSKVQPYNTGYELKLTIDYDWKMIDQIPREIGDHLHKLTSNGYVYLQPASFFESYLEEGIATIEGKVLELHAESKPKYEETYPKWKITQKSEIPNVGKEFVKLIEDQVKAVEKALSL